MEALFVWYVWLAVALVTLLLELLMPGFIIGCFSAGAMVAAIVAAFGGGVNAQLIVFAAVSVGVFILIRPFALKYWLKPGNEGRTNYQALAGRTGKVVTAIDPRTMKGEVKVDGDIFPARSQHGVPIPAGTEVKILSLDSITVVVKELNKQQQE